MANAYELKAKRVAALAVKNAGGIAEAGKNTIIDAIAAIVGGGIGAMGGRYTGIIGLVVNAIGNYYKTQDPSELEGVKAVLPYLKPLGLGMMVGLVPGVSKQMKGFEPELEGFDAAKERLKTFATGISEKFFLDTIFKKGADDAKKTTSGFGDLEQFSFPEGTGEIGELGAGNVDFSELDKIQKQIEESGKRYGRNMNGDFAGLLSNVEATDEVDGLGYAGDDIQLDPSENNY